MKHWQEGGFYELQKYYSQISARLVCKRNLLAVKLLRPSMGYLCNKTCIKCSQNKQ